MRQPPRLPRLRRGGWVAGWGRAGRFGGAASCVGSARRAPRRPHENKTNPLGSPAPLDHPTGPRPHTMAAAAGGGVRRVASLGEQCARGRLPRSGSGTRCARRQSSTKGSRRGARSRGVRRVERQKGAKQKTHRPTDAGAGGLRSPAARRPRRWHELTVAHALGRRWRASACRGAAGSVFEAVTSWSAEKSILASPCLHRQRARSAVD